MKLRWLALVLTAQILRAGEIPDGATELNLVNAPALSPDGKSMAFEWLGDIWTASIRGGEATRIVADPGRDAYPLFSPDGARVVFSSDRSGALQVYSVPRAGGEARRHTWHTEGNELMSLSPDGSHAIVRGFRDRAGVRSALLMVVNLTADERERRLFDAPGDEAAWSPDGASVLFTSRGEQLYRKGYQGARASQIWRYELGSGKFTPLVTGPDEARFPAWQPDGKSFTYLSNRSGTLNLWRWADGESTPLTRLTGDSVFTRGPAADGNTFVIHRGFGLFRLEIGAEPVPLTLWTRENVAGDATFTQQIRSTTSADFTADLQSVVFAAAGELWLQDAVGKTTRLTRTAAAESSVRFSPDGKWLYFLRDDGLAADFFRARLANGELRDEQAVTRGPRSKSRLKPSPDGKRLAWIEGTGDVFTSAADGSGPQRVFASWDLPTFDWSPDGRWLAIAAEDRNANRDIWLAAADGSRPPVDLTRHPAFEGSPRWSPDGRWLVFSARRTSDGMTRLWRIDFGKNGVSDRSDLALQRLADRAKLLPTGGMEPTRVIWAADSESLLFQSKDAADAAVREVRLADGTVKTRARSRGVPIRMAQDGSLLWRVDRAPAVLAATGESTAFPVRLSVKRDLREVMTLAFRRIWRTLGERFYDPTMNGTDWPAALARYEPEVEKARSSRQFDRLVSQLFGELNASHLSFLRKPWQEELRKAKREPATAHPGLVFREAGPDDGPLVIERVLEGSPAAELEDGPEAGEAVVRIAGEPVHHRTPLHRFLDGAVNRTLPMVLRAADGRERTVGIRCISHARARTLDARRRLAENRIRVRRALPGAAYLALPDMSLETVRAAELEIYRHSLTATGLILDLRNNGGGREADRLLSYFVQPAHSFTVPRGGPAGYPNARLVHASFHGPLVVLCNQNTFSNSEIFCHALKRSGRAPLVGTATAGGVISAVKSFIPDAGELQVPFRGWFEIDSGKNLDLNGARPDVPVELTPADEDAGRDPQLAKALELLGEQVATAEALPEPVLRRE